MTSAFMSILLFLAPVDSHADASSKKPPLKVTCTIEEGAEMARARVSETPSAESNTSYEYVILESFTDTIRFKTQLTVGYQTAVESQAFQLPGDKNRYKIFVSYPNDAFVDEAVLPHIWYGLVKISDNESSQASQPEFVDRFQFPSRRLVIAASSFVVTKSLILGTPFGATTLFAFANPMMDTGALSCSVNRE